MSVDSAAPTQLRKVLGTRDLIVYYVSTLVGTGILVVPGIALELAGPASLVAWLVLAVVAFPFAAAFARFSAAYPSAAGTSYLIRRAFGDRLGAAAGLFLLLLNLVVNPVLGLAAARYFAALMGWQGHTVILLVGFAAMSLGVVANMLGIRLASQVQLILVFSLIAGLVSVIAVSAPAAEPERLTPFAPYGWSAVGAAVLVSFFSFFGWEHVSHVADEVRDPRRSYPRAALTAAGIIGALYCALALVVALVVPSRAGTDNTAVLTALLRISHGEGAARLGSALAVFLIVVNINAWVFGASRLLYAMARDGAVPRRLSAVTRAGTPMAALWVCWVCYALDIVGLYVLGGDEHNLVPFASASTLVVYLLTFAAGMRLFEDRAMRTVCVVALTASAAFLLGGGLPSLLAVLAFAATGGYVVLRRRSV
ncbi:APC family permease [Streptomyces sporangiiformans]|uniref:APC family permease n=1 Tax=Streptomyces sporangiiformans TaxID=2315329 RepID=UPI0013C4B716|nr:APC family permease [Streptomyces sporangiiformans]